MAIAAPTRPLLILLFTTYNLLVIAFGVGIWRIYFQRKLRIIATLFIGYAIIGLVTLLFFPMHQRGAEKTISDTMHIVLTIVTVILTLLLIGMAAPLYGNKFRVYSITTIVILLLFGVLAGSNAPRLAAQQSTPWLGITERVNIYTYLLWVAVLAVTLLKQERAAVNISK